jgi:glycosyltransferase involved in cell wall biosynthesis
MLSKACVVGSYQKKLEELAAFSDIDLVVIVPPFWKDERGTLNLERVYTKGYELLVRPLIFNGNFHLHFFPGLGRLIEKLKPDIIHIDEEPYNLSTWQAVRIARRVGAKSLFFTWQNLLRHYPPPFNWMERFVLSSVDHAIVGNQEAVNVWKAKHYLGPITVIPQFGVDPALYSYRGARHLDGRPLVIGYAGRLVKEKGVDLILRAAAQLQYKWHLRVLGSGPQHDYLETLASELGIASHVEFLSPIPSTDMPQFMHTLDVLVLPSRTRPNWKEQFGRVLVEAMACGVSVIGSESGEIPFVMDNAGLVFSENDADSLRDSLIHLHDDSLRQKMAETGHARMLAKYTQVRIAQETRDVYLAIMGLAKDKRQ